MLVNGAPRMQGPADTAVFFFGSPKLNKDVTASDIKEMLNFG